MNGLTLDGAQVLLWLRDMPATKAIPRLLEVVGGSMTQGAIADALELKGKTLDNTLPILARAGVVTLEGRTVTLGSPENAPTVAQQLPEIAPSNARDLPDVSPTLARTLPDDDPNTARDLPETCPNSGNTVNNEEIQQIGETVQPISIVFSSLEVVNKQQNTNTTTNSRKKQKSESREPKPAPLRAKSSWAELLKDPDFDIPNWLDLSYWQRWLTDLEERKLKITSGALHEQLDKLRDLSNKGFTQEFVIKTAISRGWKTVGEVDWFTPKASSGTLRPPTSAKSATAAENFEKLQAAFQRSAQASAPTIEVKSHD